MATYEEIVGSQANVNQLRHEYHLRGEQGVWDFITSAWDTPTPQATVNEVIFRLTGPAHAGQLAMQFPDQIVGLPLIPVDPRLQGGFEYDLVIGYRPRGGGPVEYRSVYANVEAAYSAEALLEAAQEDLPGLVGEDCQSPPCEGFAGYEIQSVTVRGILRG